MPRQGQIIPTALVPHVETYINDYSIFQDTAATPSENGVRSIHVFASPKGEDGVIKEITSTTEYLEEYGIPNYDLYGQPGYMPYAALTSQNAKCWCMRVMPDTATYANAIVVANITSGKTTDEDGKQTFSTTETITVEPAIPEVKDGNGTTTQQAVAAKELTLPVLRVKFRTENNDKIEKTETNADGENIKTITYQGITNKDEFATISEKYKNTTTGEPEQITNADGSTTNGDTYYPYPILGVISKGRGVYGNALSLRIVTDSLSDQDNGYKNYAFEVYDKDGGSSKKETFTASLNSNAIVSNVSIFADDVINESDDNSSWVEVNTSTGNLEEIYKLYEEVFAERQAKIKEYNENKDNIVKVPEEAKIPYEKFDFIHASNVAGYVIISDDDTISFDIEGGGIILNGGDDSTFSSTANAADRLKALDDAYIAAFKGEIDTAILSKRRTPAEVIYDANYSMKVKQALAALAIKRYDARCILDANLLNTTQEAITWATNPNGIFNISDKIISKECNNYKMRDPFTGKTMRVTTTYYLAANIPTHYTTFGNQVPFVGRDYALLTGYIKNSLRPMIDADDIDTKEALYTNRVNFFECIAEDTYVRGVQGTSQKQWSDLSEENNVAVVLEMKRILEEFVSSKLYNFAEAEDRVLFTQDADRLFADYRNKKVRSFNVYFDMNAFEEERSILHCYLAVVFRTIAKRGIIEIDINKRV